MPICSCVQYVCSGQVHLKSVQNLLEKVTPHFKVSPTNEREGGVGWGGNWASNPINLFGRNQGKKLTFWGQNWRKTLLRLEGQQGQNREGGRRRREGITDWARTFALLDGN